VQSTCEVYAVRLAVQQACGSMVAAPICINDPGFYFVKYLIHKSTLYGFKPKERLAAYVDLWIRLWNNHRPR
jgi:hypothetical protein